MTQLLIRQKRSMQLIAKYEGLQTTTSRVHDSRTFKGLPSMFHSFLVGHFTSNYNPVMKVS